ncbi:MAG: hypothetical protein JST85_21695 [Acidobacteria bacterium]|nr:hypothetical protein [Acidobacteriota bacterium]
MTANEKISQRTVIRARVGWELVETVGEVMVGRTLRKTIMFGYGRGEPFKRRQKTNSAAEPTTKRTLLAAGPTAEFVTAPFPSPIHLWLKT